VDALPQIGGGAPLEGQRESDPGLHPYSVGRQGVADYYDSQPLGMTAAYRILETRQLSDDLVLGYLSVDFSFTDRPTLNVHLSTLVRRASDGWYISHYQVSHLD
jgi:hypothetical protein